MIVAEIYTAKAKYPTGSGERRKVYLRDQGKKGNIVMAGRYPDGHGGIVVWKVDSLEKAKSLADDDPFVKEGLISFELNEWKVGFDYTIDPPRIV
jgi:uncharacterized protein